MLRLSGGSFGSVCDKCARRTVKNFINRKPTTTDIHRQLHIQTYRNHNEFLVVVNTKSFLNPQRFHHQHLKFSILRGPAYHRKWGFNSAVVSYGVGRRHFGQTARVLRGIRKFLKLRYVFLTGAVGGGYALNKTIDTWRGYLPDLEWMKEYIPENENLMRIFQQIKDAKDRMSLPEKGWFRNNVMSKANVLKEWVSDLYNVEEGLSRTYALLLGASNSENEATHNNMVPMVGMVNPTPEKQSTEKKRLEKVQEEMIEIQIRYQREVDRLEKENKELRKQLILRDKKEGRKRSMKKSCIDMYSDVLDELAGYDSSYNTQDNLPRVVVVGDQSSGKTSVLEMIARARIFPRGSGEMMTRSPVKVTLAEGPYHVASFKDSNREFDLTKESDLAALRKEVEVRMKASVLEGETVSTDCISMTVKGPGLQRMVLVDLPGIISTVTTDMAPDTKDSIKKIVRSYMENPNAIVLCIQDGSLDAERSNVTDLVNQMDPGGKRTIFVLTKVDLTEMNLYNPDRIKSILEGKLFPMKALGYFAVVTGRGNTNDSISSIKNYEEQFFRSSKLFKDGALKPTQMGTQSLSIAVSELFWKLVRETVEQQADAFKATRFNLETEWKNTFPRLRELDRDELFEKARGEILDEVINLSQVTPKQWEDTFYKKVWEKSSTYVIENIYLPAAQTHNSGIFNTSIDIKLKQWADAQLPRKCVEVGWQTLHEEFQKLIARDRTGKLRDDLFDQLKLAVISATKSGHNWDNKAEDSLRVIQVNTLEDRSVSDKQQWDSAVKFMEDTVRDKLNQTEDTLNQLTGPGTREQWLHWRYRTEHHKNRISTLSELEKLIASDKNHKAVLAHDELTTVKRNLQTQGVDVDTEFIKETWYHIFRKHFFKTALRQAHECRKGFYYYQRGFSDTGLECNDVVLFWRLQRMLQVTSNALRQQVVNNEARRLERIIKDTLDDFSDDKDLLQKLLTGRRVQLAEELKRVRQIQDKLEEFVQALNKEK